MRRLWIAILMLASIVLLCVFGYSWLSSTTQQISNHIAQADTLLLVENPHAAREELHEAYRMWRAKQAMLGSIVRHDELDDIENLFQRAMQSMDDAQICEYRLQARELRGLLAHLPEMEQPIVQNIF